MPVYKNETLETITERVENSDGVRSMVKITPGKSKTTEFVLLDAGLTEVSAAPYYNPLMDTHSVTSTGVGDDKTISIDRETKLIIIHNSSDADVLVFLRSTVNTPGLPVPTSTLREFSVGCNVDQIVCQFSVAGTILIEERK